MKAPLRLALLQMEAVAGDVAANLDRIAAAAVKAAAAGADCLCRKITHQGSLTRTWRQQPRPA